MNIHLLIPASGIGSRFGDNIVKQYALMSHGQTIIDTTISALLPLNFASITIVIRSNDIWWQHSQHYNSPHINTVIGGKERYHSVINGVTNILTYAKNQDLVAVHDAVRPLVDITSIRKLIKRIITYPNCIGGLLVAPHYDSIKIKEGETLKNYPRDHIYRALTPQIYNIKILKEALQYCITSNINITDEASAIEIFDPNSITCFVESTLTNIKITTPTDLVIANSLWEYYQTD